MSEPGQVKRLISQLHKSTGEVVKNKPRYILHNMLMSCDFFVSGFPLTWKTWNLALKNPMHGKIMELQKKDIFMEKLWNFVSVRPILVFQN